MPYQTKTKFKLMASPASAPAASSAPVPMAQDPGAAALPRSERAALDDVAWRQWLDACPRYPGGCLSCAAAMLNMIYFCQGANRAVFGADVIEVELAPAAGRPAIEKNRRRGVQLNLNLSGVHPFLERAQRTRGAA